MPSPLNENLAPGLVVREEYGIPVEFACPVPSILEPREAAAVDSDVRTIDVNFSYEFAILDPRESIEEVMEQDLPNLEYGILYLVAKSIGLLKCELQRQNVSSWATDVLTDSTNTEPYIVSLSSGANDQPKTDIAGCESLVDIPSGWICVPIKGSMSANFVGAELDAQAVENYLIHYIEREIDSEDVRVNGIQEVVFLVQTADVGAPSTGDTTSRTREAERNDGRATHVALASSLSIAFVLVVLVLFAVMRRRRLSTKDYPTVLVREIDEAQLEGKENLVSGDSGDADDSEVDFPSYTQSSSGGDGDGATQRMDTQLDVENPPQLLRSSTATTLPTSNVKSLVPATSSMTTLPTTNKTGHQSPASPQLSPTTSVGDSRASATAVPTCFSLDAPAILSDIAGSEEEKTKAVVVDGSSTNSGSALSTTPLPALADVLPPKPPGAASAKPPAGTSKTIKVTRKKKKKKKKPSLIRVNSRESMNEMETITEENDEEKNSDCSEYSWCSTDDEDSSRPGSRDPSPARSNPRSRDPSPSRSNPRSRDASPSTRSRGSNNNNSGSSLDLINNSSSSSLDSSQMLTTIDVPASSSSFDDKESGGTKKNRLPAWV